MESLMAVNWSTAYGSNIISISPGRTPLGPRNWLESSNWVEGNYTYLPVISVSTEHRRAG